MEFEKEVIAAQLIVRNNQFSAKMQAPELELAQQALARLSPEAQKLLVLNEDHSVQHRSYLLAVLHDFVNNTGNTIDLELVQEYDRTISALHEKHTADLQKLQDQLSEKNQVIQELTEKVNLIAPDANNLTYDTDKYILLEKNIIQLTDFFNSFEKRKEAGQTKTYEEFIYQLYYAVVKDLPFRRKGENNLIFTPENYK